MQTTVKELVKQNNEKRKILTSENQKYYENMLVYIRTNALKSERATEEVLLEMLDHLIEAQKEGKSAEDVFGKTPKELAEEIIETLPKETFKDMLDFGFEIAFTLFGWYLAISGLFPLITRQDQTIHLGSVFLSAVCLISSIILLIYFIFRVIKRNAFEDKVTKSKVHWLFGLLFVLLLGIGISVNYFFDPFGPSLTISFMFEFGLGCFFLLAAFLFKKMRESK
ncbi:DUF1129 family protein [Ureibacillus sinduriensis]|uniref:DUF1129 family protein n=1 Tax=Ureibacillus sinduriensis TaxID=561440 RepID=UPI00068FBB76|nr:DUF1129 family protein [Ureibacillus sinduriensis]